MKKDCVDKAFAACICGHLPQMRLTFGQLAVGCVNAKCKLKPDTWLHQKDIYDVRILIKFWNEGINGK